MKTKFPLYFRHSTRSDFYKIESLEKGHFLRNMRGADGSYCFQSSNVKEGEIRLVMEAKDGSIKLIEEKEYLLALKEQTRRNSQILLTIENKLLEL